MENKVKNILSINFPVFSHKDSTYIKGVAIFMIVCHNFFHWLQPILGENEFSFKQEYADNFIKGILEHPFNAFYYIAIYWGHCFLQLFIFLSGYGLTVAYANKKIKYTAFLKKRLVKIYLVFSVSLIGLIVYDFGIYNMNFDTNTLTNLFFRFSLLANLIPNKTFVINGPYWFYSMIVQLYLLFPILIYIQKRYKYALLVVVVCCYAMIFGFNPYFDSIKFSLYYNVIGNLPVFCFGVLYAIYSGIINRKINYITPLALLILVVSLFNIYAWYLSQISFLALFIFVYLRKNIRVPNYIKKSLFFLGIMSHFIFAVHGYLRKPWVGFSNKYNTIVTDYLFLILFFMMSLLVAYFVMKITSFIRHKI